MSNFDQKAYFEKNFPAIENPLNDNKIALKIKDWMKDNHYKTITLAFMHNGHDSLKIVGVEVDNQ